MEFDLAQATVKASEYYGVVDEYKSMKVNKNNTSQKDLMTQQWVKMMIERILAAQLIVTKEGYTTLHESVKTTLRTYLVDKTNDKKTLVLKPIPGKEHRSKTIIPLEETYEVVQKAHHQTNHGTPKEMEAWLVSNNFLMNSMCVPAYCKLCVECSKSDTQPPSDSEQDIAVQDIAEREIVFQEITDPDIANREITIQDLAEMEIIEQNIRDAPKPANICEVESYKHVCSVDVLDITENPDNFYCFLLIHEDRKNNFVQLRPLNSNCEAEISMELIKILMDFGPPECIVVDGDNKQIFLRILDRLKVLSNYDIALALHKSENKLIQVVANNIITWMKEEDCKNWGTGCHVVQWKMNNSPDVTGTTPFSRIFGYKYTGFGYKSKFIPQDLVNDNSDDDIVNLDLDDADDVEGNIEQDEQEPATNFQTADKACDEEAYLVTMTEELVKTETDDPIADLVLGGSPTLRLDIIKNEIEED